MCLLKITIFNFMPAEARRNHTTRTDSYKRSPTPAYPHISKQIVSFTKRSMHIHTVHILYLYILSYTLARCIQQFCVFPDPRLHSCQFVIDYLRKFMRFCVASPFSYCLVPSALLNAYIHSDHMCVCMYVLLQ